MPDDAAELDVVLKAKAEGMEAFRDMRDAIADLRNRQLELAAAQGAVAASGAAAAASTAALAATSGGGIPVIGGLAAALGSLGASLTGVLVVAVVGLVAALSMLILAVAGAVVILAAFAAGIATVAVVLGSAFLMLGFVTGAVILLADSLFKAGLAADPLKQLEQHFRALAITLGQQAYPMAVLMINAFDQMLPRIQAVGTQILTWFGGQLPAILNIATATVNILLDAWQRLALVLESFINRAIAMSPALLGLFRSMLEVGVVALQGLLTNLLALTAWFVERLPVMGPIVAQIMGFIGSAMLAAAAAVGQLTDWFILKWPQITRAAQEVWSVLGPILAEIVKAAGAAVNWFVDNWPKIRDVAVQTWLSIKSGWDQLAPVLTTVLPLAVAVVVQAFQFMNQHADAVKIALTLLGAAAVVVVGILVVLTVAVVVLVAAVVGLIAFVQWLTGVLFQAYVALLQLLGQIWATTGGLAALGGAIASLPLAALLGLLQTVIAVLGAVAGAAWALASAFSGAFGVAMGAVNGLLGALSAIPGAASRAIGAVSGIAGAVGGALGAVSNLAGAAGALYGIVPGFASGGVVPGPMGAPTLAVVHGGETVIPAGGSRGGTGSGMNITVNVQSGADPYQIANEIAWALKTN